jgi:hypothetical protein
MLKLGCGGGHVHTGDEQQLCGRRDDDDEQSTKRVSLLRVRDIDLRRLRPLHLGHGFWPEAERDQFDHLPLNSAQTG